MRTPKRRIFVEVNNPTGIVTNDSKSGTPELRAMTSAPNNGRAPYGAPPSKPGPIPVDTASGL